MTQAGQGQPGARRWQHMGTSKLMLPLGAKGSALRGPLDRACQAPRSVRAGTHGREIAEPVVQSPLPWGPAQVGRGRRAGGRSSPQPPRKPLRRTDEDGRRRVLKRSDFVSPLTFCLHVFLSTIPTPLLVEPRRWPRDVSENSYAGKNFTVRAAGRPAAEEDRARFYRSLGRGRRPCVLRPTLPSPGQCPLQVSRRSPRPASAQTARSRNKTGPAPHIIQDT